MKPPEQQPQELFSIHNQAGNYVLTVARETELDMNNAPTLERTLNDKLHENDFTSMVIDITGVSFIDIYALNTLARFHNNCYKRQRQSSILISEDQKNIARAFKLAGLYQKLKVVELHSIKQR